MLKIKNNYHSALSDELKITSEIFYHELNGNYAIQNNVFNGLPEEFGLCDVIYSEPSWLFGYDKFSDRANKERSSYKEYLSAISKIITNINKPIWIVTGLHALKKLPKPETCLNIKLHGYAAVVLGWNDSFCYEGFKTNYDFINLLASRFNRVGDFSCGYGNTGRIFKEHGKNFVLSDINGKCIYHISKELT